MMSYKIDSFERFLRNMDSLTIQIYIPKNFLNTYVVKVPPESIASLCIIDLMTSLAKEYPKAAIKLRISTKDNITYKSMSLNQLEYYRKLLLKGAIQNEYK